MSAEHADELALRQPSGSLAASESAALGLLPDDDDSDDADPTLEFPSSPSPNYAPPTGRVRSEHEFQLERNRRMNEVEPGLSQFRDVRVLHIRQLKDLEKKTVMVTERIDKFTADIEKLRQQWGELEREKAKLLETQQLYEQKKTAQQKVVHKDDVIGQKYHDYLELDAEVLVLDDSEDENEDGDGPMYDWQGQGHEGGEGEEEEQ